MVELDHRRRSHEAQEHQANRHEEEERAAGNHSVYFQSSFQGQGAIGTVHGVPSNATMTTMKSA